MSVSPAKLSEGQSVRVIPRDASSDARGIPYYAFYEGLSGTIAKLYPDGSVSVLVDRDSLPESIRDRHERQEREMQDKWLRGLSEEDRSRLTDKQREFTLRYTLLVAPGDVSALGSPAPKAVNSGKASSKAAEAEPPARLSAADLDAAEQRRLDESKKRANGK